MEGTPNTHLTAEPPHPWGCVIGEQWSPFAHEWVTISKQEHIELRHRASYWEAQHGRAKAKIAQLEQELVVKDAKIKDLQNRLFGKKSEKHAGLKSEKGNPTEPPSRRRRGQQPGRSGHGRTQRPHLPVVTEERDLSAQEKRCAQCGLPHRRNPALDEQGEVIEVEVRAHLRRYRRQSYTRHPGCRCEVTPAIITAAAPPKLIARSPYGVSFWVEVILGKYRYGQPPHRYLQDLADQGLAVSPGTVAGGLQALLPLFEPVREALYDQQMSEQLFHNDETRWEVFVEVEDKVGTRWYLWLTRSASVIFYCLDPHRSAAVPGAHFAGLKHERIIIVCDRYSAYKKLARLVEGILLAFCWAHVRRDFLDAGRSFVQLQGWALEWKERIGTVYHLNQLRLEQWDPQRALSEQSEAFAQHHQALQTTLQGLHDEATAVVAPDTPPGKPSLAPLAKRSRIRL
jgi:transposase